jgi:CBS domain-containing protein
MATVRDTTLVEASVPETATFADAARVIAEVEVGAIAVLDGRARVVGLFTSDDLLRGLFPGYLDEMDHTAFLEGTAIEPRPERSADRPVRAFAQRPEVVELDADLAHAAARFLHCPHDAIAVVDDGRFVGMLGQVEFCRAILRSASA